MTPGSALAPAPGIAPGNTSIAHDPLDPDTAELIFVVGAPRSGTTLMATIIDRHPQVAIPRETDFVHEVVPLDWWRAAPMGHEAMVDRWAKAKSWDSLELTPKALLEPFSPGPAEWRRLFLAGLHLYTRNRGKTRPGEKTPRHLDYVPLFMHWFPKARFVAMVRDGRDVLLSQSKVPWNESGTRKRCLRWRMNMAQTAHLAERFPDRVITVRFEKLVTNAEAEVKRIDAFLGLPFDPGQLDHTRPTGTVGADWDKQKIKVTLPIDASRASAWRRELPNHLRWTYNVMMADWLGRLGYSDTDVSDCPWPLRLYERLRRWDYLLRHNRPPASVRQRLRGLPKSR